MDTELVELRIGQREGVGAWNSSDWDTRGACAEDFDEICDFLESRGWVRQSIESPHVTLRTMVHPDQTAKIELRVVSCS